MPIISSCSKLSIRQRFTNKFFHKDEKSLFLYKNRLARRNLKLIPVLCCKVREKRMIAFNDKEGTQTITRNADIDADLIYNKDRNDRDRMAE